VQLLPPAGLPGPLAEAVGHVFVYHGEQCRVCWTLGCVVAAAWAGRYSRRLRRARLCADCALAGVEASAVPAAAPTMHTAPSNTRYRVHPRFLCVRQHTHTSHTHRQQPHPASARTSVTVTTACPHSRACQQRLAAGMLLVVGMLLAQAWAQSRAWAGTAARPCAGVARKLRARVTGRQGA
jgi:hypothetical protein